VTYGHVFPAILGSYTQPKKQKKKHPNKGYQLEPSGRGKIVYSDELIAHIKWLAKTKPTHEIGKIFPEISRNYLERICLGDARSRVIAKFSRNYPILARHSMKILLEFELLKDEPNITDLIAQRVYMLDVVDKHKDVTATIVDLVEVPVHEMPEELP
jgi:hypothetical protein